MIIEGYMICMHYGQFFALKVNSVCSEFFVRQEETVRISMFNNRDVNGDLDGKNERICLFQHINSSTTYSIS